MGLGLGTDVANELSHHNIGQIARQVAVGTTLKTPLVILRVVDSQRADDVVIQTYTSIRVECQHHVDGDRLAILLGQTLRTTHQRIDPVGTRHVVVLIVVHILLWSINILLETRPLQPVT